MSVSAARGSRRARRHRRRGRAAGGWQLPPLPDNMVRSSASDDGAELENDAKGTLTETQQTIPPAAAKSGPKEVRA